MGDDPIKLDYAEPKPRTNTTMGKVGAVLGVVIYAALALPLFGLLLKGAIFDKPSLPPAAWITYSVLGTFFTWRAIVSFRRITR